MSKALGLIETRGLIGAIEAADAMLKAANVSLAGQERVSAGLVTIKVIGDVAAVKSAVDAGAAAAQRVGQLISLHVIPQPDEQLSALFPEVFEKPSKIKQKESAEIPKDVKENVKVEVGELKERDATEANKITKLHEGEPKKKERKKRVSYQAAGESLFESSNDTITRLRQEALGSEKRPAGKESKLPADLDLGISPDEITEELIENLNVHQLRHLARSREDFPIKGRVISRANRSELMTYFREILK